MDLLKSCTFLIVFFLSSHILNARTITDTLYTDDNDCLIISYDLTQEGNQFIIKFNEVRKRLGHFNRSKYQNLREVIPFVFDRIGIYNGVSFEGEYPLPFKKTSDFEYEKFREGYLRIEEGSTLNFSLVDVDESVIQVPISLAHYRKKGKYDIFGFCELDIPLKKTKKHLASTPLQYVEKIETSTIEIEAENEDIVEALSVIDRLRNSLLMADHLPFDESLTYDVGKLLSLRDKVDDDEVIDKINETLDSYNLTKKRLEDEREAEEAEKMFAAERKTIEAQEKAQAHADSIAMISQKQAEKAQKRNIWMILGGLAMVVLTFISNQIFQHFRSLRNQRSMIEIQEKVARKAEYEATQRINSTISNKVYDVRKRVRKNVQEKTKGNKGNINKSNHSKNISI